MDVIPLILEEEVAKVLPKEILVKLADCSTDIIKQKVMLYMKDPEADPEVRDKVKAAFAAQVQKEEYLASDELKEAVDLILPLDYSDISPHISLEKLESYRTAINKVLENEYAVPYIAPISGSIVKELKEEVHILGKNMNNREVIKFAEKLKKHSNLFRDSPHAPYKGTVAKKVIRNRSKYEIIARGIVFISEKKRQQEKPMSWRYL